VAKIEHYCPNKILKFNAKRLLMETILITGGTGLIGTALTDLLISQGYKVVILTRELRRQVKENISYARWDVRKGKIDSSAIASADHIIHMAGAGVADKRWSGRRKKEIVSSRVDSSRLLIKALTEIPNKVQTIVSASAIGWYGPDAKGSKKAFVEADPPGNDFLGNTCRMWEESIQPVTALGKRLVILRTSIVLSNKGGAFPELVKTRKFGIASILGSGDQVISWIHIDDISRMYLYAITNKGTQGVYNAAAPEHVTNKELVLKTARAKKRPFIAVHVPAFALKIILGEMSIEVLKSTTVDDAKIRNTGFKFLYPTVDAALNQLDQKPSVSFS
jgi:hypothetical protein